MSAINAELRAAIDNLIQFYAGLSAADLALEGLTPDGLAAIVTQLQNAKFEAADVGRILGISIGDIAQQATSDAVSSLDRFAESIVQGSNAINALGQTFAEFATNFLRQIADMIIQQTIFNLISGLARSLSGGFGTPGGVGEFSIPVAHTGGVIGRDSLPTRTVSPAWFQNAMRYHSGGIAGLKPGEIPAILQRGEDVLTAQDPRHVGNGGGAGQQPINLRVVNAIDGDDLVQKALAGPVGERAVLNLIRNQLERRAVGARLIVLKRDTRFPARDRLTDLASGVDGCDKRPLGAATTN